MRDSFGSLVAAMVVAGCVESPRLGVVVEHDPAYVDLVATTTITVYEGENIACGAIELGDVGGAELDLLEVARVEISGVDRTGDFDGVFSRTGHKAVVARGFDATGHLVLVECTDVDEVVGSQTVTIATTPAASVSIATAEDGQRGVLVLVTDPRSAPIDRRPVSWRLFGAAGTSADPAKFTNVADGIWEPRTPTCTTDGEATIHPAPPKVPGAFAVQARVSWAAQAPPLFTQFTPLDTGPIGDLDRGFDKPCALLRSGATTIVCLETPTRAREFALTGKALAPTARIQTFGQPVLALVSIANGADLDVYAITDAGAWLAVLGAPAPTPNAAWDCGGGTCSTFDLQIAPACGGSPSQLIGRVGLLDATAGLQAMPIKGGPPRNFGGANAGAISNAGCITELQVDGSVETRQAIVVETGDLIPAAVAFECAANPTGCVIPLSNEGVGFVGGAEDRMVVSTFDATGTVLSTVVVRPNDQASTGQDRFIERARQPAAAPPRQLIAGRFDGDGDVDLVWHFTTQLARQSNVQVAYAREVAGAPITAILPIGGAVVDMFAADLNGDGFDDLLFVLDKTERVGNQQVTTRRLQVVAAGIEYDGFEVVDDPPCP